MPTSLVITGIASFPNIFKPVPRSKDYPDELVYKLSVLIKKDDPQIAVIRNIIEAEGGSGRDTPCFKDGATDNYFSKDPIHHDYYIISANVDASNAKPPVVGPLPNLTPIIDPLKAKAGMMCTMYVSIHSYTKGRGGVRAGLEGVMFHGEKIILQLVAPQKTATEMFGRITSQIPQIPQMTGTAQHSYESYIESGWTHQQLVENGLINR